MRNCRGLRVFRDFDLAGNRSPGDPAVLQWARVRFGRGWIQRLRLQRRTLKRWSPHILQTECANSVPDNRSSRGIFDDVSVSSSVGLLHRSDGTAVDDQHL